jgi:hypothetical protein
MSTRTTDPFVAFFYELLRDYVPVGVVQGVVEGQGHGDGVWELTDEELTGIATRMCGALRKQKVMWRCLEHELEEKRPPFKKLKEGELQRKSMVMSCCEPHSITDTQLTKSSEAEITDEMVAYIRERLGEDGIDFFRIVKQHKGKLNCVLTADERQYIAENGEAPPKQSNEIGAAALREAAGPHPIHLREGMWVRNRLRDSGLCRDWSDHDFDNNWARVVERVIEEEP